MKRRFAVYISFSVIIALLLIGSATLIQLVQARQPSADIATWIQAQRTTPLLWLMDVAAFSLLFMMFRAGAEVARSQELARVHAELAAEQLRQQEEHHRQVEALIARNVLQEKQLAEMEEINQERAAMIRSLEAEAEARQREFEAEARRLTEQAFHALQGTVEAQGRQLDAVNMALQYHRAEVTQLRHTLYARHPTSEPAQIARLTPAELAAITESSVAAALSDDAEPSASYMGEGRKEAVPTAGADAETLPTLALTEVRPEAAAPVVTPLIEAGGQAPAAAAEPEPSEDDDSALTEAIEDAPEHAVVQPSVAPPPFLDYLVREKERAIDRVRATVPVPDSLTHLIPEVTAEDFSLPAATNVSTETEPEEVADVSTPTEPPAADAGGAQAPAPQKWQIKI